MSDTSQGPGWWIASDGKWYPPDQAQQAAPTAPQVSAPGIPGAPAPTGPTGPGVTPEPPPAKKSSGSKGCIIALAVVGGLIVLGIGGCAVAVGVLGHKAGKSLESALEQKPCTVLTSDQASSVLGDKYDVIQLKGFNAVGNIILDTRVLSDVDGCWIRPADGSSANRQGRVAQTGGGSARYDQELKASKGTTQDRGNGLSVESQGYFLKDVDGLGDEAFCTASELTGSSGVLFRKGDTVTYVSISPATNDSGMPLNDDSCDTSVKLAKKIAG